MGASLVALALVLSTATDAFAAVFGHRYLTGACCTITGMRANIRVNATPIATQSDYITVRVFVQSSSVVASAGLMQVGLDRIGPTSGGHPDPDCGTGARAAPRVFWEWKFNGSTTYNCEYGATITSFPNEARYTTLRSGGGSDWSVYYAGNSMKEAVGLGFADSVYAGAGGETDQGNSNTILNSEVGTGSTPWQRTTNTNTPWSWTTIQSSSCVEQPAISSAWKVGSLPSPFVVSLHIGSASGCP